MRRLILGLTIIGLSTGGCAHYRSGAGYRSDGTGEFRVPSDYPAPSTNSQQTTSTAETYQPHSDFRLFWPVKNLKINRGFRTARAPEHLGLDLGGRRSTPIMAAHEGVVIYTGRKFHGFGNMVLIEYSGEWATLYAHLDKIIAREGQVVLPGDIIGRMGKTGHASGVHLHFELMHNRQPVDPLPLLNHTGAHSRVAVGNTDTTDY